MIHVVSGLRTLKRRRLWLLDLPCLVSLKIGAACLEEREMREMIVEERERVSERDALIRGVCWGSALFNILCGD